MSTQVLPRSTPEIQAWVGLLRAHATVTRRLNAELVAEHGLTLNDYEVLLHLARADGRRLRRVDLAEGVLLTPSGITRLLEGLERSGYVERASCESDARVTYAQLTDDGLAKLRKASDSHVAGISGVFGERFSAEELLGLAALLEREGLQGGLLDRLVVLGLLEECGYSGFKQSAQVLLTSFTSSSVSGDRRAGRTPPTNRTAFGAVVFRSGPKKFAEPVSLSSTTSG